MVETNDPKLGRIMVRFTSKVGSGEYYEAHQTLRTVANRYVRSKKWSEATELVIHGINEFVGAKQLASATDLILYLLEIYELSNTECNEVAVARLVQILMIMDPEEPGIKDVCTEMNNWTVKHSNYAFGDPHLHAVIGRRLLEGGHVNEAERYLLLGTHDSLLKYVDWMWDWYKQLDKREAVGEFVGRLVFNYLAIENIKYAVEASERFLQKFIEQKAPNHERIEKGYARMYYFEEFQDLNFLQLLLVSCQSGNIDYFNRLRTQYPDVAQRYPEELKFISATFFGCQAPKQTNLLQDMMSDFFGSM